MHIVGRGVKCNDVMCYIRCKVRVMVRVRVKARVRVRVRAKVAEDLFSVIPDFAVNVFV